MSKLAGDHVRVLVDGYELTGDSNHLSIRDARDQYDVASFGDEAHHFINGKRLINLEHQGFMNAAAARSHPVLKGNTVAGVVSVWVGQNAAPVVGDPVFSLDSLQTAYLPKPEVNNVIPFTAQFANRGLMGGWGVALAVPTSFTDSTNGSVVDGGAATTNGGATFLHILTAAATDTYTLMVAGSATGVFGGEESTLATFSMDAAQVGSQRVAISGTLPLYTRWQAVRTGSAGDTVKLAISLIRF